MGIIRRLLPWLVAVALLAYLFTRYPIDQVLAAVAWVNPLSFTSFLVLYFLYFSLADGWSLNKCLERYRIRGSLWTLLRLRLASNLAMILNYGAGQGVLAYLISRHYKVPFTRSTAVLLLVLSADLYLALTIACAASLFTRPVIGETPLGPWIQSLWLLVSLTLAAAAALLRKWPPATRPGGALMGSLLSAAGEFRTRDYLGILLWRLPLHLATNTYLFFLAPCFGVSIPLDKVVTLLPLSVIIGAIPITPSGLGTVQASTIYFFHTFVSGDAVSAGVLKPSEALLAMSLMFTLGIYVLKLATGLLFLRGVFDTSTRNEQDAPG